MKNNLSLNNSIRDLKSSSYSNKNSHDEKNNIHNSKNKPKGPSSYYHTKSPHISKSNLYTAPTNFKLKSTLLNLHSQANTMHNISTKNKKSKNSTNKTIFTKLTEDLYKNMTITKTSSNFNYEDFVNDTHLDMLNNKKTNKLLNEQIIHNFVTRSTSKQKKMVPCSRNKTFNYGSGDSRTKKVKSCNSSRTPAEFFTEQKMFLEKKESNLKKVEEKVRTVENTHMKDKPSLTQKTVNIAGKNQKCKDVFTRLYQNKLNDDIEKIGTSKKDVTKPFHKIINFNDFYFFAEDNLRNDFLRRQRTDLNCFELWLVGQTVKAKYRKCELDQQYLIDYAYLINNLDDDEIIQIFPMTMYLNENITIRETKQKVISDIVERNIIKQKGFAKFDLIIFAMFSVFTLTRNINVNENAIYEVNLLIHLASFTKYNLRKYFLNLLRIYQLLYFKAYKDGNKDNEMKIYAKCFNIIRKYIYENNILPNEELMSLISSEIIPYEQIKAINNTSKVINTVKFEYVGLRDSKDESNVKEHEKKIWVYSDNIGICSEICLEVEREERSNKYSKRSIDSNDTFEGTPLEIDCIVIGEESTKNKRTKFYSLLKVFKELDKLVNKFTNTLELNEYDKKNPV